LISLVINAQGRQLTILGQSVDTQEGRAFQRGGKSWHDNIKKMAYAKKFLQTLKIF
jgi:hypothetical protein